MLCGWEGNCRSDIALVVCYRIHQFIHLQAQGLGMGDDEHPTNTRLGVW